LASSKIEWTNSTWNPLTGCSKISPGCKNCYAERMARRLQAMGQPHYQNGFRVTVHTDAFQTPLKKWKTPRLIFVNSMSDLFHEQVPIDFILNIFSIMKQANWHVFQVLTKRSERLVELSGKIDWPKNVWMGVSVENSNYSYRIDQLQTISAFKKFLSLEPLLGPLPNINLSGIDWVIVGGESGPKSRAIEEEWVIDIRDQCIARRIPFFFKQWGGTNKKKAGKILEGRIWDEFPELIPRSIQMLGEK
jgi:protein gp37